MIPSIIKSTYLQYKDDTDAVASWLATTAQAHGFRVNFLNNDPNCKENDKQASEEPFNKQTSTPKPSGRLKGKARKVAREAQKNANLDSTSTATNTQTYIIPIKDFVRLAEQLVQCKKPAVRVPASFTGAIDRAIATRQSHGEQISRSGRQADEGHTFFIDILQQVRDILCPRTPRNTSTSAETHLGTETHSSNRFDGLKVEETSDQFLNKPDVMLKNPKPKATVRFEAERNDLDEALFGFYLMLEDYHELHTLICECWKEYREGTSDLICVSVTTNAAIELARHLEEEGRHLFDKHGGSHALLSELSQAWLNQFTEGCQQDPSSIREYFETACQKYASGRVRQADWFDFEMMFWSTYRNLNVFMKVTNSGQLRSLNPENYREYDRSTSHHLKTARDRAAEERSLLFATLSQIYLVWSDDRIIPVRDELSRGLCESFEHRKLSFSVVFAAQVYVETHKILQDKVSKPHEEMQTLERAMTGSITKLTKNHEAQGGDKWLRSGEGYQVISAWRLINIVWVIQDPLVERKAMMKNEGLSPDCPEMAFNLMENHPVLCGLFAFLLKISYHKIGAILESWNFIIVDTHHLCSLLRKGGFLQRDWPAMAVFTALQKKILKRTLSAKFEDYFKLWILNEGLSATVFAKERRKNTGLATSGRKADYLLHAVDGLFAPKTKNRRRKRVKLSAPVSTMLMMRFDPEAGGGNMSLEDLQKIMAKSSCENSEIEEAISKISAIRVSDTSIEAEAVEATSSPSQRPTARDILKKLHSTLQCEEKQLDFDYLEMHRVCWRLLHSVHDSCNTLILEYFERGPFDALNMEGLLIAILETSLALDNYDKEKCEDAKKILEQAASTIEAQLEISEQA
ncbi:hypothetical protein MMC10_001134 [Thelotrema lepadinum]|nr:hypothetical protein [Thelotrema lepadinum]